MKHYKCFVAFFLIFLGDERAQFNGRGIFFKVGGHE